MSKDKYPLYGFALVLGAGVAVWAGLSPLLLVLLICPVMMFFMMRGMQGGQQHQDGPRGAGMDAPAHVQAQPPAASQARQLDGSHERIDGP